MKLYKNSERSLKINDMLNAYKHMGFASKNLGRWCKWKELRDGGRLQVKLDIYEVKNDMITFYMIGDTLDRVAAPATESKHEVLDWLNEHEYKTEKRWYLEDYGMTAEAWNSWNNANDSEE